MRRHFLLRSFLSWELSLISFVFETIGALIYIFIYVA